MTHSCGIKEKATVIAENTKIIIRAYGDKYYENLKAVVAYVRNHLSEKTGEDYSKLPFIFGTVAKKNKQYGSEVEEAMKRLAKEDKNAYLIDMSDAELMGDAFISIRIQPNIWANRCTSR